MALISEFVTMSSVLQTAVAPRSNFSTGLFLVDDDQVPVDVRYRLVTASDYDDWTAATDPYLFAQQYFSQKRQPSSLMIGRWVSAASSPYYVCGTPSIVLDDWTSISDGEFTATDGTNSDNITGLDFSSCTSTANVVSVLTAGLTGLISPNITGLNTSAFELDATGRLRLVMSTTGASAATVSIVAYAGSGTDITTSSYLDVSDGFAVDGLDAEEPTAALAAISDISDDYYMVMCERSLSTSQQVAVAAWVESKTKMACLVYTSTDAKSSATTTDLGYLLYNLSYNRTAHIYSEHTDQWPDAALIGCVLPANEGTTEFAFEALSGVYESGKAADGSAKPLTTTEISVLDDKNYNRIANVGGNIFTSKGMCASGVEMRVILGRDWMDARIAEDVFTRKLQNSFSGFDNDFLAQIEDIVRYYTGEAVTRKILVDTQARPLTISFPDADDFTQAQRASHDMELSNIYTGYLNSAAVGVAITGTMVI